MITRGSKIGWIQTAVKRIGEKHPTEKHDFGDQENPHAERTGLALLLQVFEVMLERRVSRLVMYGYALCQLPLPRSLWLAADNRVRHFQTLVLHLADHLHFFRWCELVCFPRDHGRRIEILCRRRRRSSPFESRQVPWIR